MLVVVRGFVQLLLQLRHVVLGFLQFIAELLNRFGGTIVGTLGFRGGLVGLVSLLHHHVALFRALMVLTLDRLHELRLGGDLAVLFGNLIRDFLCRLLVLATLLLVLLHLLLRIVDGLLLLGMSLLGSLRYVSIQLRRLPTGIIGIDELATQAFLLRGLFLDTFGDGLQLTVVVLPLRTELLRERQHILQILLFTLQHLVGLVVGVGERLDNLVGIALQLIEHNIRLVDDVTDRRCLTAVLLVAEDEPVVLPFGAVDTCLDLLAGELLNVSHLGMLPEFVPCLDTFDLRLSRLFKGFGGSIEIPDTFSDVHVLAANHDGLDAFVSLLLELRHLFTGIFRRLSHALQSGIGLTCVDMKLNGCDLFSYCAHNLVCLCRKKFLESPIAIHSV